MPNIGDTYKHRGSGKSGYPLGCEIIDRTLKGFKVKEIWPKNKTKTGFYNSMDFIEKDDPMNNRALWIKESKMTPKQEKFLTENHIRLMVRKILREDKVQPRNELDNRLYQSLKDLASLCLYLSDPNKPITNDEFNKFKNELHRRYRAVEEYSRLAK